MTNEPPPPIGFDVKESDVVITGGFGAEKDRYIRRGDPQPGDAIEVVRFTCEEKVCAAAAGPSKSPMGDVFERRLGACLDVRSRAPTAKEVAHVNAVFGRDTGSVSVPERHLFVFERISRRREEVLRSQECPKDDRHPCDPAMIPTGRFVERTSVDVFGMGPRRAGVLVPFMTWRLHWIELTRWPAPLERIDLSAEPAKIRAAVAFDRAVEAVRSKDRARIAAAVKVVDENVTITEGARIDDQSIPRIVAQTIVNDMPHIRAVADGRATIGDACER